MRSIYLGWLLTGLALTPALAVERVALVIGNGRYQNVQPLKNPGNDARDLSAELRELGFAVTEVLDADLKGMEQAVDAFVGKLGSDSAALFHYSGHGLQVQQENYLIPVDFELKDEASVKFDALSASKVHERMAGSGSKLNIVILDACRNNGFSLSRSSGAGLAAMNAARGSFIAFSTSPGNIAADNPDGRNGLFTGYLLEELRSPGLTLDEVFNRVRRKTYAASNERQLPWSSSSVIGSFYFLPGDGPAEQRDLQLVSEDNPQVTPAAARQATPGGSRPVPPPASASTAELDERLTQVAARASAVRASLDQLKQSQARSGPPPPPPPPPWAPLPGLGWKIFPPLCLNPCRPDPSPVFPIAPVPGEKGTFPPCAGTCAHPRGRVRPPPPLVCLLASPKLLP